MQIANFKWDQSGKGSRKLRFWHCPASSSPEVSACILPTLKGTVRRRWQQRSPLLASSSKLASFNKLESSGTFMQVAGFKRNRSGNGSRTLCFWHPPASSSPEAPACTLPSMKARKGCQHSLLLRSSSKLESRGSCMHIAYIERRSQTTMAVAVLAASILKQVLRQGVLLAYCPIW